jgi:hydroxyacylglutathione hydrolase
VLLKQFVDDDLGCASYLVGDEAAGVAVVIDPAYAIDQYLEEAAHRSVRLLRVLETTPTPTTFPVMGGSRSSTGYR